jgi:Arc/MetJ-type ribon-helix-helix transcriptional regulator
MPSLQLSITLDDQLVAFLDQQGSNRSAAVAEAVRRWRDEQWLEQVNRAYAEEAYPGAAQ